MKQAKAKRGPRRVLLRDCCNYNRVKYSLTVGAVRSRLIDYYSVKNK